MPRVYWEEIAELFLSPQCGQNYILQGRALLGIVYSIRPESPSLIKPELSSGHVLVCVSVSVYSSLKWTAQS